MQRPNKNEYASYYETYISKVPEGNILDLLRQQVNAMQSYVQNIPEEKGLFKYAPDKWTIKEVLGHINDGERIFGYRALRFSRNDKNQLPGFEQDDFVKESNFNEIKLADMLDEFVKLREANIATFKNFSEAMWTRRGVASKNEMSVRAVPYIIYGHVQHHLNVLQEKYL